MAGQGSAIIVGDGGQVVTVTTFDELVQYVSAPELYVIQISGTITSSDGNYVKLKHQDGKLTYYAHLQIWSIKVAKGQSVSCGQHLGNVASSGNSTGNHLHFEVRVNGTVKTDPFTGQCHGGSSFWVQQGSYLGRPGTQ